MICNHVVEEDYTCRPCADAKVEKFRTAFIKLAIHNKACESYKWDGPGHDTMRPCSCGYDQALADTEGE